MRRAPEIFRTFHGERLSLSEIARRAGCYRSFVERVAAESDDVTDRIVEWRRRMDIRLCAQSLGLPMVIVRMRLYRGKSVAEALRA